jgi:metal-responsive CopG/Arc/MetJ family transcriptional regulator
MRFPKLSIHNPKREAMVKAYVNIKLPEELAREVDELVKDRTLGYRSRGEFVTEATRTLLIKIKSLKKG